MLGIREERNIRIDLVAICFVTRFAMFYDLNKTQWAILTAVMFMVPSLELMNTAVERAVAKPDAIHDIFAGQAKDTAAASVFFMAFGAVIIAVILFCDYQILNEIYYYYAHSFTHLGILLISIVVAYLFIIKDKFEDKN